MTNIYLCSSAVKTFNAETGRSKKQPKCKPLPVSIIYCHHILSYNIQFAVIMFFFTNVNKKGAPKQPGGHECGYYVMRYMKEIIDDEKLGFATKVSIILWRKLDLNIFLFFFFSDDYNVYQSLCSGRQRLEKNTPKGNLTRCALKWLTSYRIFCRESDYQSWSGNN